MSEREHEAVVDSLESSPPDRLPFKEWWRYGRPEPAVAEQVENHFTQLYERREREKGAFLDVRFDHEAFRSLMEQKDLPPQLLELAELYLRLPEDLSFERGVTLVVGDNGAGKSTLAKGVYLALKAREKIEYYQKLAFQEGENHLDHFHTATQTGRDNVFTVRSFDSQQALFLQKAGLAALFGQALDVRDMLSHRRIDYLDFAEIFGREQQRQEEAHQYAYQAHGQEERYRAQQAQLAGESYVKQNLSAQAALDRSMHGVEHRSNRQTVDDAVRRKRREHQKVTGVIDFFDEPEAGLSPRRHLRLEEEIGSLMPPESIAIVPTNSVVLFESDLPRIDLDYPERGIHRPSQYGPILRD